LTMRYITTSGVTRLSPLEYSGKSSEIIKELPRLILPETVAPAYIEEVPQAVLTVEQLRSMGAQVATLSEQERAVLDNVLDDSVEGQQASQMNAMAELLPGNAMGEPLEQPSMTGQVPMAAPADNFVGGMPLPSSSRIIEGESVVSGPSVPGAGPVIAVGTGYDDFMRDGLPPPGMGGMGGMGGFGRQVRRNPFRGGMGGMGGMGEMGPMMPRYTPMEGGMNMPSSSNGSAPLRITKLE
jgi:hypothetical protein